MISFTPNRGVGIGQRRDIIRGSIFLPLAVAATLRPSYNEYPERVAMDVGFPQPGRRGPSRPPSSSRGGVSGGEAGAGGGAGGGGAPVSVYPGARERVSSSVGGVASGVGGLSGSGYCVEEGDSVRSSPNLLAVTSRVVPTNRIPRPFVVTHIQYWSENTIPDLNMEIGLQIKVSDDNDTSGGLDSTGINIIQSSAAIAAGGNVLEPFNFVMTMYPNSLVDQAGKFIKFCWRNQNAAARQAYAIVSFKYIG